MANTTPRDPQKMRELSKLAVAAKKRKREEEAKNAQVVAAAKAVDPVAVLQEIAKNRNYSPAARAKAAELLIREGEEDDAAWKTSVQVRSDFVPPSWKEVLSLARDLGAWDDPA